MPTEPHLPSVPDSAAGPDHDPTVSLAPALGLLADRLSWDVSGAESDGHTAVAIPWGDDAGARPTEYWHWLHLRALERAGSPATVSHEPGPLISIVVPIYRPALWYFEACVRSVQHQTYPNWELCLCDDGSGDAELTECITRMADADPRIKAGALATNGGISRATNAALAQATGEFVALLDHDDLLDAEALSEVAAVAMRHGDADVIYTDDDKYDELDRPFQPQFKPDWSPDLLLSYPYLGHLTVIRRSLLEDIGGFRPEFDGSQDFDVMLRATERARRVVHIPKVLYHWRVVAGSAAGDPEAKPWAYDASRRVVEDAICRQGISGWVDKGPFLGGYSVRRRVEGEPSVSVLVPFRDQAAMTMRCLDSVERTAGDRLSEVVLVDNGSSEPETAAFRRRLQGRPRTRLLDHPGAFNWAAINNSAAATCTSDFLLFLNNDIEPVEAGWLDAMLEHGQRAEVGAVGARLVYRNGVLQHTGVVLGLGGVAGHLLAGLPKGRIGYAGWDRVVRQYLAVTAACMLVRREVFEALGGFDEQFAVAFNDTDFCLRLGEAGYRVLSTPHAELVHDESISRGLSGFYHDYQRFLARWSRVLSQEDPFYNPNLSRMESWCALRMPGEDLRWSELVGGLRQAEASPSEDCGAPEAAVAIRE